MSAHDGNLKIGDIVSSFYKNKGFWRVTEIKDRFHGAVQYPSDIHLELVMSIEGVPPKKKARTLTMPASWLTKVDEEQVQAWREADEIKWNKLFECVKVKTEQEIVEELIKKGESIPEPEILSFFGPPLSLEKEQENGISNASQVS